MTVPIERAVFDALPVDAVGHACFKPMIPAYRQATHGREKAEAAQTRAAFMKALLPGQRALFMFFTYYDHAIRSQDVFWRISEHYLSAQFFGAVKKSAEFFGDTDMLSLLTETEQAVPDNRRGELPALYQRLREIAPATVTKIGARIQQAPAKFVCLA